MILIRIRYRVLCYVSFEISRLLQYFLKKVPLEYESKGRKRIGVPSPPPPISPFHGLLSERIRNGNLNIIRKKQEQQIQRNKKLKLYVFLVFSL
jgi:hypothetical protein